MGATFKSFLFTILEHDFTGTDEERGILIWREVVDSPDSESDLAFVNDTRLTMKTYDLPFGMNLINSLSWGKYVPIFPTFKDFGNSSCFKSGEHDLEMLSVADHDESSKD